MRFLVNICKVSFLLAFVHTIAFITPATAGVSRHEVLLVVNDLSPISLAIGDYYQSARGIPDVNVCHLTSLIACPTVETISVEDWYDKVRTPIWNHINTTYPWLKDQIKVILLTKGVPLRVAGEASRAASVDMPLCYLGNVSNAGTEPVGSYAESTLFYNPYFGQDESFGQFRDDSANQATTAFPAITSICSFNAGAIMAAGVQGLLIRTTDGSTWPAIADRQRHFAGTPFVCITSAGGCGWAIQSNSRMLKSPNNGESWDVVRYSSGDVLHSISFADANNGWAVGSLNNNPFVLRTTAGGSSSTWSSVDLSSLSLPSCTLNSVCTAGAEGTVACGTGGVVISRVLSGGNWTWVKATGIPNVTYNGAALKLSGTTYVGWVVGDSGKILKTTDGGTTWQEQDSGQTTLSLKGIFALDDSNAWVTTNTTTLLRTSNGGTTWQTLTLQSGQNIQSVYFSDSSNGFAANGSSSILSSIDGGTNWSTAFTGQSTVWHKKYLACRLDGYQLPADANNLPLDIKRMIDDACFPDSTGRFVLDQAWAGDRNGWTAAAGATLLDMKNNGASGIEEVLLDATSTYLTGEQRVMGYCSSGSNDSNSKAYSQWAKTNNQWQKGSLSTTYVSSSGRTLNYPPDYASLTPVLQSTAAPAGTIQIDPCWQNWSGAIHDNQTGETWSAVTSYSGYITFSVPHSITDGYLKVFYPDGSVAATINASTNAPLAPTQYYSIYHQSLIADSIREGCSASIGNVYEPYLDACGQPQYLLPRYASGYTWAESAYISMAWAGWREVAAGDPMMAAYATPPTVTMTSPNANGLSISGTTYNVAATATPVNATGINRVEFWLSNGDGIDALLATVTSAPYSITFDTTTLAAPYSQSIPDGRYVLEAVAYEDTNVRECGRFSRPVIINNGGSPTTVSITTPATDGVTLSNTATIAVSATPSTPPSTARVDLWLHSATRDMMIGTIPSGTAFNFPFDTTEVPDGSYELQAVAYSSTNQASASSIRQVYVDNSALVQISEPATDGQQKSGKFTITASTDPNASIARVDFWLGQGSDRGVVIASDSASPYTYDLDSTTLASGDYVITAYAYDASSNLLGVSDPRTVTINNSALLAFTAPATNGQTVSGSLAVQATAGTSDPVVNRIDLWPYGQYAGYAITSTDTSSPFNWALDTTTMPNGSYTMKVAAYKLGGAQVADSPTRTFTVNNPNLLSVTTPATDGTIVSGTTSLVIGTQSSTPDYGRIEINLTGQSTSATFNITSRPFEYALNTTSYTDGVYTITVYAYKPDGRKVVNSSATRTFIINNNHTECDRITEARALANSSSCLLEGKAVSAGTSSSMENAFYIEETDRSAGVRVAWTGSTVPTGKKVTVLGTIGNNTSTGERQITADSVWVSTEDATINPMGLNGLAVGGTAPASESYTQGITGGVGLYNTGLLVRIWGKVNYVGSNYIYINEGSNLQDGNSLEGPIIVPLDGGDIPTEYPPVVGLRVYCGSLNKPGIGDYVALTGISSMNIIGSNYVRCVRLRSQNDVTYVDSYIKCIKQQGGQHFLREDLTTIPIGSKVRLVNGLVQVNYGTYLKVIHTGITGVFSYVQATTQLPPYTQLFKMITVTGTTVEGTYGDEIVADCIYQGGSYYGAMSLNPGGTESAMSLSALAMEENPEYADCGGGPFRPWPYPTAEEILASPAFQTAYYRLGNIGWVLSQSDGSVLDLRAVTINGDWYNGCVLGLREWFEPIPQGANLLLYLDAPIKIDSRHRDMATIDIIGGKLMTLNNGKKALVKPAAVYVYTDSEGESMFPLPWLKTQTRTGVIPDEWPWKLKIAP